MDEDSRGTSPGPIQWKRTWVDDRPAFYGVLGEGMPVLFLHGWALAHHTYRGVVQRVAAKGCRVYAPALPGFGGTADLPSREFSILGYARWVEAFVRSIELNEKAVVVGHSFGGGVSIKFAHAYPELVRSLVLVNSIGGSSWKKGNALQSIASRPLWDWGLHFPADVWPLPQATKVIPVLLEDAVPNLLRNPRSLLRVSQLARRADLRPELEDLKQWGLPVTVLWGSRDGVIPRESFEAMCIAVGASGTVIEGSHSWLLADPDRFGEIITNDLEIAKLARQLEQGVPARARRTIFGRRRGDRPRELRSLTDPDATPGTDEG